MNTTIDAALPPQRALRALLWVAQVVLAFFLLFGAYMKLAAPADELAKMMVWATEYPTLKSFTGIVDLLGGLGIVLPALTRIRPRLTVLAAIGIIVLQVLAFSFHASRGEWSATPLNLILLALAVFVLWGRSRAVLKSNGTGGL
ncbi:MAG: DoxX family protein [Rhodanobacteraceae bacterium]|nr:DoxX family protein [Rhodanobacteraceae bacterium]